MCISHWAEIEYFRADSLSDALSIIGRIFSFSLCLEQPYMWFFVALVVLLTSGMTAFTKSGKMRFKANKSNMNNVDGFYPVMDSTKF